VGEREVKVQMAAVDELDFEPEENDEMNGNASAAPTRVKTKVCQALKP
jgi:hypothetical protein